MTQNTSAVKCEKFKKEFADLICKSVEAGVPLKQIIASCADAEFENRILLMQIKEERKNEALTKLIIQPAVFENGKVKN